MSVTIDKQLDASGAVLIARLTRPDVPEGQTFDLDLLQAVPLENALAELTAAAQKKVVLDLSRVGYMDSKTFWAVVRAANVLTSSGGRLVVSNLHPNIARLLTLTGADEYLQAYADAQTAAAALM